MGKLKSPIPSIVMVPLILKYSNLFDCFSGFAAAVLFVFSFAASTSTPANPTHLYPGNVDADIWVLAGQSNMLGSASLPDHLDPPDPRILMFNMDNTWIVAQDPLHRIFEAEAPIIRQFRYNDGVSKEEYERLRERSKVTPLGGVGPGLFFARHIAKFMDRPLGLIPNSPGGSTLEHWDPALRDRKGDSLYGAMMDRIEMVGGKVKGFIWYQGESEALDANRVPGYESALLNLFDSLRRDTVQPDLPILYVQISRYAKSNDPAASWQLETVREIQRRAAQQRNGIYMVSAIDLPLEDEIHLNYSGQERLGKRLAEVALTHIYQQEGHAHSIGIESVNVLNPNTRRPEIHVKFSGVSGRLLSPGQPSGFEVRFPSKEGQTPQIFRTDLDSTDPSRVILRVGSPLEKPAQLYYGGGTNPYVNIVDEKDIPVPAFGPIELNWE